MTSFGSKIQVIGYGQHYAMVHILFLLTFVYTHLKLFVALFANIESKYGGSFYLGCLDAKLPCVARIGYGFQWLDKSAYGIGGLKISSS